MAKETKSRVVFQRSALGTRIALLVMLCVRIAQEELGLYLPDTVLFDTK